MQHLIEFLLTILPIFGPAIAYLVMAGFSPRTEGEFGSPLWVPLREAGDCFGGFASWVRGMRPSAEVREIVAIMAALVLCVALWFAGGWLTAGDLRGLVVGAMKHRVELGALLGKNSAFHLVWEPVAMFAWIFIDATLTVISALAVLWRIANFFSKLWRGGAVVA